MLPCIVNSEIDEQAQQRAEALAQRVGLADVLDRNAGTLPHGVQKRLDVALALAAVPDNRVVIPVIALVLIVGGVLFARVTDPVTRSAEPAP